LILLTTGLIYSIINFAQIHPIILFESNIYPLGFKRKSLLLQKLTEDTKKEEESKESILPEIINDTFPTPDRKLLCEDLEQKFL